jgi:hypothetical protein
MTIDDPAAILSELWFEKPGGAIATGNHQSGRERISEPAIRSIN